MTHLEQTSRTSPARGADTLSNGRRREALAALREAGEPLALADLAHDLVVGGRGAATSAADFDAVERRYVGLYHVDVPKLAAAGVVEFDAARRVVGLAD